jgi:hypothetical protein
VSRKNVLRFVELERREHTYIHTYILGVFQMSFSGSRSPHHPKELADPNSPVSDISSVAKMTPREQQEMLELLSCTKPLFNQPSPLDASCK